MPFDFPWHTHTRYVVRAFDPICCSADARLLFEVGTLRRTVAHEVCSVSDFPGMHSDASAHGSTPAPKWRNTQPWCSGYVTHDSMAYICPFTTIYIPKSVVSVITDHRARQRSSELRGDSRYCRCNDSQLVVHSRIPDIFNSCRPCSAVSQVSCIGVFTSDPPVYVSVYLVWLKD